MRFFLFAFLIMLTPLPEVAGQSGATITGVDFWHENNSLIVGYNIVSNSPDDKFTVGLKFVNETGMVINPRSLSGDVGRNVQSGTGKTIKWDAASDQADFTGNLKAVVTISQPGVYSNGPSYALLSVAVPGLGGHFVQEDKIRPVATTATVLGLITYGIIKKAESNRYYDDYRNSVYTGAENADYDKANAAHHKYYIATRLAAVIWVSDIIWVASRGKNNQKQVRAGQQAYPGSGMSMSYMNNEVRIGYRLLF